MNTTQWNQSILPISAVIVSALAALFTIGSFWWLHWRRGRLIVSKPKSFSLARTSDRIVLELPLSFYNNGAAPIVIDNLLLRIKNQNENILLFHNATRIKLGDREQQWATQIPVDGRKAVMNVYSFHTEIPSSCMNIGEWHCLLLGKLDCKTTYKELGKFDLYVTQINASLLTYDNYQEEYKTMKSKG